MTLYLYVIILGIVEGLTEFIPVSSTGHMILVENFLNMEGFRKSFMDSFLIIVQFGSIISVVVLFWKDINPIVRNKEVRKEKIILWTKIAAASVPAAVIGLIFDDYISEYFFGNITIVAIMLIFYGIFFLFFNKISGSERKVENLGDITYKMAIVLGFFQCLAMIPGTSRSGATILGALLLGFARPIAAEFSFFMAIPVMFGGTLLKLLKNGTDFTPQEWGLNLVGSLTAFIVALFVIKWLIDYLKSRDFKVFGVYRIIIGIIVLLLF